MRAPPQSPDHSPHAMSGRPHTRLKLEKKSPDIALADGCHMALSLAERLLTHALGQKVRPTAVLSSEVSHGDATGVYRVPRPQHAGVLRHLTLPAPAPYNLPLRALTSLYISTEGCHLHRRTNSLGDCCVQLHLSGRQTDVGLEQTPMSNELPPHLRESTTARSRHHWPNHCPSTLWPPPLAPNRKGALEIACKYQAARLTPAPAPFVCLGGCWIRMRLARNAEVVLCEAVQDRGTPAYDDFAVFCFLFGGGGFGLPPEAQHVKRSRNVQKGRFD